jgi:2-methylfumaryl-CoA hydratase
MHSRRHGPGCAAHDDKVTTPIMSKTSTGNFFEDFRIGEVIRHATPRTITAGDVALYDGLFGPRFAVQSSDVFARAIGYPRAPVDDLLVFHVVFGKTVPDISLNAVANLGYAACRVLAPVYPGDTLDAVSEVIGLKENSSRKTGIVFVRSTGCKQDGSKVLEYVRWVMVRKRDEAAPAPGDHVPRLPDAVLPGTLGDACPRIDVAAYDFALAGSRNRFGDYAVGEKIDHVDGMTVEEAEHQIATRLYQNTARIHFDQHSAAQGRFGRRLIYGGHVISLARSLSFNGLANAFHIAAINGGRHVSPLFAGATRRRRRAAFAHGGNQGPPLRRLPAQVGRRGRPRGAARSRLLGADAALAHVPVRSSQHRQQTRSAPSPIGRGVG